MNNKELIEGCIYNDNVAQHFFYEQYSPRVMGICMRYGADDKDTEAMARYVFKHLYEEITKCTPGTDIDEWVYMRTIWNAIEYLHQDKQKYFIAKTTRYNEQPGSNVGSEHEVIANDEDARKIYLSALRALTPSYRILYNLTYIDEITPGIIIKNLEIAGETYKAELEQARFQFKQRLISYLHDNKAGIDFEKEARTLLISLSAACPASVWQQVSAELETRPVKTSKTWVDKASGIPKTVLMAAGGVVVLMLCGWIFLTGKSSKSNTVVEKQAAVQPAPQPVKAKSPDNKPAPSVAPAVAKVSPAVVKKDNIFNKKTGNNIELADVSPIIPSSVLADNDTIEPVVAKKSKSKPHTAKLQEEKNTDVSVTDAQINQGVEVNLNSSGSSSAHAIMGLMPANNDSVASVQGGNAQ